FDVVATRSDNATVTDRETISVGVVEGNTPPTIDPIADKSVEAGTLLAFTAMASDPDVPPNGISWSLDSASTGKGIGINATTGAFTWTPTSAQAGNHSVTVTATDDGVLSLNHSVTFNVGVTLSITLDTIGDKAVSESSLLTFTASATVPGGITTPIYSLEGSVPSGAAIDPSTGVFSWQTDENDGPGSYVFDVVAARSDIATITDRETISVGVLEDNASPIIDSIANKTVNAGTLLTFTATASDPDLPPNDVSWAIDTASAAKGMSINLVTGAFSWTPASPHAGNHSVTVTAVDDGVQTLTGTFTFTIEVTLSITLASIEDQAVNENSLLSFMADATTPGGIAVPVYSLEGAVPGGAAIDPRTGIFRWVPNESDGPGTFSFDVVAKRSDNATVSARETIPVVVSEVNANPIIAAISNKTIAAGSQLAFTATATDLDLPQNGISWSFDSVSTGKGMEINPATGAFTWSPLSTHAGNHSVTLIVTDNGVTPLDHRITFNIEVSLSITLGTVGDQSVNENSPLAFIATATVPGGNAVPVYSLAGSVPNGATINPDSGAFQWMPSESDGPGTFSFDVIATRSDDATTTDRETISIEVAEINVAPSIDPINDTSVQAGSQLA
ncbi:MAG: putative Ig domain-containing protein, partial [Verrucomicrobiales bacterium]